jgi:hypothetical protein
MEVRLSSTQAVKALPKSLHPARQGESHGPLHCTQFCTHSLCHVKANHSKDEAGYWAIKHSLSIIWGNEWHSTVNDSNC